MPYPVVHFMFFVLCINAVAVYATFGSLFRKEMTYRSAMPILLLLFIGGLCSLFPDIIIVHSFLVNGTMEHCMIGSVPTHSLLFSSSALLFGTVAGYAVYRTFDKAKYVGLFGEAAFISHLLLDEIFEPQGFPYLYPIYSGPIKLTSLMDINIMNGIFDYLLVSFSVVLSICFVIMMALFAI